MLGETRVDPQSGMGAEMVPNFERERDQRKHIDGYGKNAEGVEFVAADKRCMLARGVDELNALGVFAVAINVFALIAFSLEVWDHFGSHAGLGIDSGLAQHLALSLLWTAYASVLIALGVSRESALLRWQAVVLFGLVVLKVFIYDSSFLERFYRIVSFFILGLVLLTVSFLYQRKVARERSSS